MKIVYLCLLLIIGILLAVIDIFIPSLPNVSILVCITWMIMGFVWGAYIEKLHPGDG